MKNLSPILLALFVIPGFAPAQALLNTGLSHEDAKEFFRQKGYSDIEVLFVLNGIHAELEVRNASAFPVPKLASPVNNICTVAVWARRKEDRKLDYYQSLFMFDAKLGWFQCTIFDTEPGSPTAGKRGVEILSQTEGKVLKEVHK